MNVIFMAMINIASVERGYSLLMSFAANQSTSISLFLTSDFMDINKMKPGKTPISV